ncbi:MAG: chalcone isomerase family protein [Burkholderiales bacterium]|nr:chalcone isomerase family protein [Burkholderiales bacterium]
MTSSRPFWCYAALALVATMASASTPVNIAGVKFDSEVTVRGSRLILNGAGVREIFFQKVAAAGLYVPRRARSLPDVLGQEGIKRYHVVFLRELDGNEVGKNFTSGVERNATRGEFVKLIPALVRMGEVFARKKRMATGESYSLEWVPNEGTYVYINDKLAMPEPIKEQEFFSVFLRIVAGDKANDAALRRSLLGLPSASGDPTQEGR